MRFQSIAAILAVAPLLVAADQPVRLQPASKWVLDYAENSCRLLRTFGDQANPTLLLFERASPNSALTMVVIGKALDTPPGKDSAAARFLPVKGLSFTDGQTAKSASGKDPAVLWPRVDFIPVDKKGRPLNRDLAKSDDASAERDGRPAPRDLARIARFRQERHSTAAAIVQVEVTARRGKPVLLETGSMGRAIKMLDDCARHQLKGWGIDPDLEDRIARPAWANNPQNWFSSEDYPADSLAKRERSLVEARLLIDASGRITGCTALSHVDAPAFQRAVCAAFMKRGKFRPAELADGTTVPSYATLRVRFET